MEYYCRNPYIYNPKPTISNTMVDTFMDGEIFELEWFDVPSIFIHVTGHCSPDRLLVEEIGSYHLKSIPIFRPTTHTRRFEIDVDAMRRLRSKHVDRQTFIAFMNECP